MDPAKHKIYHVDGLHSRTFLDTYCSNKPETTFEEGGLNVIIEELHYFFKFANIKGGTLIDISFGPIIYHLYSACEYFKEMILLSNQLEMKALKLKAKVKHVLKCYIDRENITDPLELPQADCLLVTHILGSISKDENDYISNLKKFAKLIKPGGQLLIFGSLNGTYYMVGEDKFFTFTYDENFMRKAIEEAGFVINHCQVHPRKAKNSLADYKAIIFISACKN
ncbi:nicotinamide N-methyltransferase-like [Pyxicephalus adspersus]|uniref:nicotinamide N-methyltransferase-like n=1 Tax=Pyxicephalus adspersus TaxID=30357 RepID=UPI003B5997CE